MNDMVPNRLAGMIALAAPKPPDMRGHIRPSQMPLFEC